MNVSRSLPGFLILLIACSSRDTASQSASATTENGAGAAPSIRSIDASTDAPRIQVVNSVEIPAGPVLGRESTCARPGPHPAIQYVPQQVESFRIDIAPVTCDEWSSCVSAGRCQESARRDFCKYGRAVVSGLDAQDYCRWRNAELPSWAQWHRAVRADRRDGFPTGASWDAARACKRPTNPNSILKRCEYTSESGVVYAMENPNEAEWTRDVECIRGEKMRLAIHLTGNDLGQPALVQKRAEFRCVVATQPAP